MKIQRTIKRYTKKGSHGFQPERTFYEGNVDGAWSPGAAFFSIATYKSQKMEEVNIFVTAEIEV